MRQRGLSGPDRPWRCVVCLLMLALGLCGSTVTFAQSLVGQRLKLTGRWTGESFEVSRTQARDATRSPQSGQVRGMIGRVDAAAQLLYLGPVRVIWDEATRFQELTVQDLTANRTIEVTGQLLAPGQLLASTMTPAASLGELMEWLGIVTSAEQPDASQWRLTVLGLPVVMPTRLDPRASSLTRRLDERRPENQLSIPVFGRPLTIGGELESTLRYRKNFDLDDAVGDDQIRLGQELQLEFFYRPASNIALFFEIKPFYDARLYDEDGERRVDWAVERGETWLYLAQLFRNEVSLQLGRQNFRENRTWWWDENLDAFRLYFDQGPFHLALGVAQEVATISTATARVAPEQARVLRFLGHATWDWARRQRLEAFFLYNHDYSGQPEVGQPIADNLEDPRDANLFWFGLRLSGRIDLHRLGDLFYWLDSAGMVGRETQFAFDEDNDGRNVVSERDRHAVAGWALDAGVSWRTDLPWNPTVTLGYAVGSGDRQPGRGGTDFTFRQTGLQENNGRFRGVNRFRYYGELLRPELSNLHIWTVAVGARFLPASSVELVYHGYRQFHALPFVRDARLDTDPGGTRRDIGQEWDVIFGFRQWKNLDIELITGLFRAGAAYEAQAGTLAFTTLFTVTVNF